MCGGHGLHHWIGALTATSATQPADVTQEIKLMYARGTIDTETFHRLIVMAGSLSREDLLRIGAMAERDEHKAQERVTPEEHSAPAKLHELEARLLRLQTQAEAAVTAAKRPDLSEEQVRAYLETSQGALFRAQEVQGEIATLREAM